MFVLYENDFQNKSIDMIFTFLNSMTSKLLPPFLFIRHELTWHGLLNHTLTIHFFYIILVMVMNLY
jgi:hypothetical protein